VLPCSITSFGPSPLRRQPGYHQGHNSTETNGICFFLTYSTAKLSFAGFS
jgi:hypothetical protein